MRERWYWRTGSARAEGSEGEATIARIVDDRLPENSHYVVAGATWERREYDALCQATLPDEDVVVHNCSQDVGVLVVVGPRSREVLQPIERSGSFE